MKAEYAKAGTIEEIRLVCSNKPLKGGMLEKFFIETDSARDPHRNVREQIRNALRDTEDKRILFFGHRGCGKSTELNKFAVEIKNEYTVVSFSIEDQMALTGACAEDLLLVICEQLLRTADDLSLKVDQKLMEPVQSFFDDVVKTSKQVFDERMSLVAGVKVKTPVFVPLLKLFAGLSADIRTNASSEQTAIAHLRKRPSDLLFHTNRLIEAVRMALPASSRLLVIVEDLDKLDIARANPIFIDNINLLAGLDVNIIYTIPVWLFYSPDVDLFKSRFEEVISLPMIKTLDPLDRAPGFETVRNIIFARIKNGLIESEAVDLLIEKTGGVLRHVFEVLHTVASMRDVSIPITKNLVRAGLNHLRNDLTRQITIPRSHFQGAPENVDALFERLAVYAKNQLSGNKNPPKADAINQILLRSCALVEYNGEGWLGVHPLVIEILEEMKLLD